MEYSLSRLYSSQLYARNPAKSLKLKPRRKESRMIECIDASTQTQFRERRSVMLSLVFFPLFVLYSALMLAFKTASSRCLPASASNPAQTRPSLSPTTTSGGGGAAGLSESLLPVGGNAVISEGDEGSPKINLYRCKRHSICEPESHYSSKESLNTLSPPNGLRVQRRASLSRRRDSFRRSSVHSLGKPPAKYISQDNPIWRTMLLPLSLVLWLLDTAYNGAMTPVRLLSRLATVAMGVQAQSGGDPLESYDDETARLAKTPAMLRRASAARVVPPPAYMLS